jgi:hypothetical protein
MGFVFFFFFFLNSIRFLSLLKYVEFLTLQLIFNTEFYALARKSCSHATLYYKIKIHISKIRKVKYVLKTLIDIEFNFFYFKYTEGLKIRHRNFEV